MRAVEALEASGASVLGIVSIFSYQLDQAVNTFEKKNIKVRSLSSFDALCEVAVERGLISKEMIGKLNLWKKKPENFS